MNGILVIDKDKNMTSRDVVNKICKVFNTKKVGHTGTLDPIATGVLVICIGKATKLVEKLTCNDKEYIATVKLGIMTDTLDTDGVVLEKRDTFLSKEKLIEVLNSFKGTYEQEVPRYSAVKINGKKLYEYARKGEVVSLPKRNVTIKDISLLQFNSEEYRFKVTVSKGTYIRSLIRDINNKLNIIGVMSDLRRIRQGVFNIESSYSLDDVSKNKFELLSIKQVLKNENCVIIDDSLFNKVKNGMIINNIYNSDDVIFIYKGEVVAIYKKYEKDSSKMKPEKMFI